MDPIYASLQEKIGYLIRQYVDGEVHTSIPAVITDVNLENQTVNAQIAIDRVINIAGKEESLRYPILTGVPFVTLQNMQYAITCPPTVGSPCLLIFSESFYHAFFENEEIDRPDVPEKHDVSNGIAIVGLNTMKSLIKDYENNGIVIRDKENETKIALKSSAILLSSATEEPNNIKLETTGGETNIIDLAANNSNVQEHMDDTSLQLSAGAPASVVRLQDDANISISTNSKNIEETLSSNTFAVKAGNQTTFTMVDAGRMVLQVGDISVTITAESIVINGNPRIVVNGGNVDVNAAEVNLTASDSFNITAPVTNFHGKVNFDGNLDIKGDVAMTGAFKLTGDMDVRLINGKPPSRKGLGGDEATKGTLTTGDLYEWSIFVLKLVLENGACHFKLPLHEEVLEINIPKAKIDACQSYDDFIQVLQDALAGGANVAYDKDQNTIVFTTIGTGNKEGYIDYLQDIIEETEHTHGTLVTGSLPADMANWKTSLKNKGLSFYFRIGVNNYVYVLTYENLNAMTDYAALATALNDLNKEFILVTNTANKLTFTTVGTGSVDGALTYAMDNPDTSSPAILESGNFNGTYDELIAQLSPQVGVAYDFAITTTVNALEAHSHKWQKYFKAHGILSGDTTSITLYRSNADCKSDGNYQTFLSNLFKPLPYLEQYNVNNVVLTTKTVGSSSQISFFQNVSSIPGSRAWLKTGKLPSFTSVQEQFQNQTKNITFFLKFQDIYGEWSYTVTPDNLKNSVDWQTLMKNSGMESKKDDAGEGIIMTCSSDNTCFVFTPSASQNYFDSLTYLQFDNSSNEINGAALFCGIEGMAINTPGVYPNDHIFPSGADWLGLTAASGGKITPGSDGTYNTNSAELVCGIAETGAVLTPGSDEVGNVVNNSATLLKGTKERDAILVPGVDAGEEPPGTFDKLSSWIGSMDISDELKCRKLTVLDGADIGGVINLKPTTVPEDDQTEREKSSVEVVGGINAETLVISKTVEIGEKLTCNDGIDVKKGDVDVQDGELKIKGCEVQGEFGKLSVQGNLDVNGEVDASDFVW